MADAVTSQTIVDGERNCVMKFTNVSDGTGESAVAKVDVSALSANSEGKACSEVRILRVSHAIVGMSVQLFFNASSNVLIMELAERMETFFSQQRVLVMVIPILLLLK